MNDMGTGRIALTLVTTTYDTYIWAFDLRRNAYGRTFVHETGIWTGM